MEETRRKIVLEQIPTNFEHRDNKEIITSFTHRITSNSVDDLIVTDSEDLNYANTVKQFISKNRKNFSQQQVDFSYEVSRLITGQLKENKPVLVPVRCGFGKSTFINTVLHTRISQQKYSSESLEDLGIIVVTERLEDLKKIQEYLYNHFGYYNHFQYDDKENKFHNVKVPWMYVMESWNDKIECKKHIKTYNESLEQCPHCEFRKDCKIGKQTDEQFYSPIIGITTARFYYYAEAGTMFRIRKWKSKGKDGVKLERKLLLIDEKPRLTKVKNVSEKSIDDLTDAVSKIEEHNDFNIRQDKLQLKNDLNDIKIEIQNIIKKYEKYRNAYVQLRKEIFSKEFMKRWETYLGYCHKEKLDAIIDMFRNGAIYCRTGQYDLFKTISMTKFILDDLKTVIFDGTAELSLEYDLNDFHFLDVKDYREYSNVTFHVVNGNYSKGKVKSNLETLTPIVQWINKKITVSTFVVSYKNASGYLYEHLKDNVNVVTYKGSDEVESIPYFGYTKGMNCFKECTKMIQIGWNRWDSDSYIAYRIATSKIIKKSFDDNYEEKFDVIQKLLENEQGVFRFADIEMYKLMHMINDFEQEVFRTRIREFTSKDPVDIYVFHCNQTMLKMIQQRFVNCKIVSDDWIEIQEYNTRKRADADDMIILNFLDWLKEWDGNAVPIKEVRDTVGITKNYWKKIKKKEFIREIWKIRKITNIKKNDINYIVANAE